MTRATSQGDPLSNPHLASSAGVPLPGASALTLWNHDAVLLMTADVFPRGKIEIGTGIDPEIEGDEYVVVSVTTPGNVTELVARDGEWHRRLREVVGSRASSYRLDLSVA